MPEREYARARPTIMPAANSTANKSARGNVTVKNKIFVSTASVFWITTMMVRIVANRAKAILNFVMSVIDVSLPDNDLALSASK